MKSRKNQALPDTFPPSSPARSGRGSSAGPQAAQPAEPPLRTVAVVGHRSCGKTQLCELLLAATGAVREQGSVAEGTSLLDAAPESRHHRQTLELSSAWLELGGRGRRDAESEDEPSGVVQVIDTPGASFLAATRDVALESVEGALVAVDAVHGIQLGTEEAFAAAAACSLPVLAVVTGVDRGLSDGLLPALAAASGMRPVWLHLPVREGDRLVGLVDVLADRLLRYADDGSGAFSPEPVPSDLGSERMLLLERLAEAVAMTDDALLEHYLEYFELPMDLLREGLARAIRARAVIPVLLTSALHGIGAQPVLSAVADWVPSLREVPRQLLEDDGTVTTLDPEGPFVARVLAEHVDADGATWHTLRILAGRPPKGDWFTARTGDRHKIRKLYRVRGPRRAAAHDPGPGTVLGTWDPLPAPVGATLTDGSRSELAWATEPRSPMVARAVRWIRPRDGDRGHALLQAVVRADAGLALEEDPWTGALLLAGADEHHLRLAREKLLRLGGEIELTLPPVGYVETPARAVRGVEGLHRKTDADGLVEEFGRCELALSPLEPLEGALFVDAMGDAEDDLPLRFRPAIDDGARLALRHGPSAGYPVVGVELQLTGGDYDMLASTEDHFRLAGQRAVRAALERSGTRLLEPWWEIVVDTPQSCLGDVISDLSAHRGRILGMEVDGARTRLSAACPYRELRTFGTRLQGLSGGRASFRGRHTHHEPLPSHLVAEAVDASPYKAQAAGEGNRAGGRAEPVAAVTLAPDAPRP